MSRNLHVTIFVTNNLGGSGINYSHPLDGWYYAIKEVLFGTYVILMSETFSKPVYNRSFKYLEIRAKRNDIRKTVDYLSVNNFNQMFKRAT